jgi:hypothetical protein
MFLQQILFGITVGTLLANTTIRILAGLPHIFLIFALAFLIQKIKNRKKEHSNF